MASVTQIQNGVKDYYGKQLGGNKDLQTSACCTAECLPERLQRIVEQLEPEILEKFYGCGSPIPYCLDGRTVLDLGCGTGRDTFICAKLVGPRGRVIGVDMTDEQLDVARRQLDVQMRRFGYSAPNVEFKQGLIEDLAALGIADNSIDVVISNCVINLSPEKGKVFAEIFRVLKPGGELCFSDVFAGRRIPAELQDDPLLRGECLAGALYLEDFRRLLHKLGCRDFREMNRNKLSLGSAEIQRKLSGIDFYSITVRAFKLDALEDRCEDFGQVAWYLGGIEGSENSFLLDDHHRFEAGRPMLVCGNTAAMLEETRYAKYFRVQGDRSKHFGLFDCGGAQKISAPAESPGCSGGACC